MGWSGLDLGPQLANPAADERDESSLKFCLVWHLHPCLRSEAGWEGISGGKARKGCLLWASRKDTMTDHRPLAKACVRDTMSRFHGLLLTADRPPAFPTPTSPPQSQGTWVVWVAYESWGPPEKPGFLPACNPVLPGRPPQPLSAHPPAPW